MGTIKPEISSHLLKMKLNTLKQKIRRKIITPETAARELYEDCATHEDLYMKDLHVIFKSVKKQAH